MFMSQKLRKNKMEKDPFGFADAISIDHLTNEQIKELEKIFENFS